MKVMLNFDDALLSHYEKVLPVLDSYGFKATFFVTINLIGMRWFMQWKQVREVHQRGYEIGNHLVHHSNMTKMSDTLMGQEVRDNQRKLIELGLPKPIVIAYPGFHCDDRVQNICWQNDCRFGRVGNAEEAGDDYYGGSGSEYRHGIDNPLEIQCKGVFGKQYGFEEFRRDVDSIEELGIFVFHDFLDYGNNYMGNPNVDIDFSIFEKSISYLKDQKYEVICYRDLL